MLTDPVTLLVILACCACFALCMASDIGHLPSAEERRRLPSDGGDRYNRLIHSSSPYLQQHAENPVDWYEWGEEAFATAKRLDRPVLLSVGYSTCHWCHVMAHESFEDAAVAAWLNEHVIAVKVDREERPDIDGVYMAYVQATTGRGGWPMTVMMTPEGRPFFGGTYFPKDRFLDMLRHLDRLWLEQRDDIVEYGERVTGQLRELGDGEAAVGPQANADVLERFAGVMRQQFDPEHAGWGRAPKFPRPAVFDALLPAIDRVPPALGKPIGEQVRQSLTAMAAGGMYDQLGGGFHRYSVDALWRVPHFEKMLYDQGQLLRIYAQAWQRFGDERYRQVVIETSDYLLRGMQHPAGGFFSAEDADSLIAHGSDEHAEGAYYVWTRDRLDEVLGIDQLALFATVYGIEVDGNIPPGSDPHGELHRQNVLYLARSIDEAAAATGQAVTAAAANLAAARSAVFAARAERPAPHRDEKILVAWNGLAISGLAWAARVTGADRFLQAARRAADFLASNCYEAPTQQLYRVWTDGQRGETRAFAADYAYLVRGLLDLAEVDPDPRHLRWAADLQRAMDERFWDEASGGWFDTDGRDASVLIRMKESYDGAEPAPSSVAADNHRRLAHVLEEFADGGRLVTAIDAFGVQLERSPAVMPVMVACADAQQHGDTALTLTGDPAAPVYAEWVDLLRQRYLPHGVLVHAAACRDLPGALVPPASDAPSASLCLGQRCLPPVQDVAGLTEQLGQLRGDQE